jgi:hypothetical protein
VHWSVQASQSLERSDSCDSPPMTSNTMSVPIAKVTAWVLTRGAQAIASALMRHSAQAGVHGSSPGVAGLACGDPGYAGVHGTNGREARDDPVSPRHVGVRGDLAVDGGPGVHRPDTPTAPPTGPLTSAVVSMVRAGSATRREPVGLRWVGGVEAGAGRLGVDRARWGASGALYPQSARAGLNPCPRVRVRRERRARSDDGQVPRNVTL